MADILLYSTRMCGFCVRAKMLLEEEDIPFREIDVTFEPEQRAALVERSGGQRTVPQIFVGDVHVGGFRELRNLQRSGQLETLLKEQGVLDRLP
ncbi:MAG: glutaredoxin 3 [Rickettsiales bacterium]|nr:glutaredoxin 3 [Rickettsiales bacterium]|tara:strand:+ start:2166 stop:2447 length:282 start_codon:yes stop_codon:yes gene_type:complete